jgi:aspartyl aminopeptidase
VRQWGVQVYGGVLLYTWFDRDLGVSGRVYSQGPDGPVAHLLRIDRPVARVASLAIHYNRSVSTDGFKPNPQQHLPPMVGLEGINDEAALDRLIREATGLEPDEVIGHDLMLHPLAPSAIGGLDGEFIFAPRLDNQGSCYTALEGLLAADVGAPTGMITLFDHEECGSGSAHGGDGALIEHVLRRIVKCHEAQDNGGFERAAAASFMVSADMAHAIHPNYADYHDGEHKPVFGGGPVIKQHVNQRYATDGETAARFRLACAAVGVPVQDFVIRTDLRCGSTIGPITSSNLAIRTVDVGCAMLSMHSIREQAASADVASMAAVKAHILSGR